MKKLLGSLLLLLVLTGTGWGFSFPAGPIELDMDNATRLYDENGDVVDVGTAPRAGLESWTFLQFGDISTLFSLGGAEDEVVWNGTDGERLYAVERGIQIKSVDPDDPTKFYFENKTGFTGYHFELFVSDITAEDWYGVSSSTDYLGMGVSNPEAIYNNLVANSTRILAGDYALSTYYLDDGINTIEALAGVQTGTGFLGGDYLNQMTTPLGLAVNAFVDIDPTVGLGNLVEGGAFGTGPDGSQYDVAIQNVRLFSEEDPNGWIISDDGTRMNIVPEPTTFALFGIGLLGMAGVCRRKNHIG